MNIKNKVIIITILFILVLCVHNVVNAELYTLKYEAVLRDKNLNAIHIIPNTSSVNVKKKNITIKGKKYVEISWSRKEVKIDFTNRCKYKIVNVGYSGYILSSSLGETLSSFLEKHPPSVKTSSSKKISEEEKIKEIRRAISQEKNKLEIVRLAEKINKKGIKYNQNCRNELFKNYKTAKNADCSSLCSYIYAETVFDENKNEKYKDIMYRDKEKTNVWTTKDFADNANGKTGKKVELETKKKVDKIFKVVKTSTGGKNNLSLTTDMRIGDSVVMYKKGKTSPEHIYMYIGDGKLIEAIKGDGGNGKTYNRVIIRTVPSYFRNSSSSYGSGNWYKLVLIRPIF